MGKVSVREPKGDVKEVILCMNLELGGKLKARDADLGENNLQMGFKAMGLDESPKGQSIKVKRNILRLKPYFFKVRGKRDWKEAASTQKKNQGRWVFWEPSRESASQK